MSDRAEATTAHDGAPLIEVERVPLDDQGRVAAVVWLNRPDQLNAISWDMQRALATALAETGSDDSVRAILITGRGRAFSAGGDIKAYKELQANAEAFTEFVDDYCRLTEGIAHLTKPVIALVNGICAAGGLELVLACDFAWAAESARIGDMHVNYAQVGGAGVMARLPRLIGQGRALELIFSGRLLTSEEAVQWGLVNRVVPDDQLLAEGIEFARHLATKSPNALHFVKQMIRRGMNVDLPSALRLERDQALKYCLTLPDSMEGINAFIEKRQPVYGVVR
jgi:enoyl-CoA hydratase/carnithine racemase